MKEVEIPGGTAQVREAADLTPRQKKRLRDAALAAGPALGRLGATGTDGYIQDSSLSAADMRRLRELQETTVCVQLASWTLTEAGEGGEERPRPLPTEATIADLDTELYQGLIAAIDAVPARDSSLDFAVSPDPKAPTDVPSDSSGTSSDEAPSPQQESLPSDGSPSATDSSSQA